jgi:MFS family permease
VSNGRLGGLVADLWRDGRGWILVVISVGQLLSIGVRVVLPALLPRIKDALLLSNTVAGVLLSLLWVSYALGQLPGGLLADAVGERLAMVASMALATVSLAVVVTAPSIWPFALGLLLLGLGTGLYATPRVTAVADIYPDRAATALGINQAFGNLGNTVLPVVAAILSGWYSWRVGLGVTLPGFVLVVAGLYAIVPSRTAAAPDRGGDSFVTTARRIAAATVTRPVLLATGAMVLIGFVWQGFTAFLPTYLVEVKGFPQSTAAIALGTFFLGGTILQPVIGGLADHFHERRILVVTTAGTAVGLLGFPFVGSLPVVLGLAAIASLQLAFWPVIFAYVPRAIPDAVEGSTFGLVRSGFLLVGAAGPVVTGALADAGLFDESFLLFAAIAAAATVLLVGLPDLA